jgi:hypothetical protein
MATTYEIAPEEVGEVAAKLIEKHHRRLTEAGVTITYLFASSDNGGPALKHNGYPAGAIVRKTTLKDRVAGLSDAIIYVDARGWAEWPIKRKEAVLDHELHHLEVKKDKEGRIEKDDAVRPKLMFRKHDIQIGGFAEIIERHGEHAVEAEQVYKASEHVQGMFPGWG